MTLKIRPAKDCSYDIAALGEVMLRLCPGDRRVATARNFTVYEGGGEYNVARGLRRVFSQRGVILTSLVDNPVGHLIEELILAGGLDPNWIKWRDFDGVGRVVRNGINFTERGFGLRGAVGVSDRGHTAASQLRTFDLDFDRLFGELGVRWFHTGGIFAGLSETTAEVIQKAAQSAKRYGTIVSYDLNYRPSLWHSIGGHEKAQAINQAIAPYVDVMLGNEEDFTAALGFQVEGVNQALTELPVDSFAQMIDRVVTTYPNLKIVATTLRKVHTATSNDWGALGWSAETGLVQAVERPRLDIYDRVGGGDSFASGLIAALLDQRSLAEAVNWGAAHGALAMTTPGDTSMVTKAEVIKCATGGNARVDR